MKQIQHNYHQDGYKDADQDNPDLWSVMQTLYGKFDFGNENKEFKSENTKTHYRPDGYSTYTAPDGNWIKMMPFRKKAKEDNQELSEKCIQLAGTVAGELFFPCRRDNGIDKGSTVNQARGSYRGQIKDMMYLTLENIKKYYEKEPEDYPLKETIERYGYFFDHFNSFDEYLEYNFLQDYELLPKKFPTNEKELVDYWENSIRFLEARLKRIEKYAIQNNLFEK